MRNKKSILKRYITAMRRYGRFVRDPDIYRRHARKGYGEGYAENKARCYFTLLAFEQGWGRMRYWMSLGMPMTLMKGKLVITSQS